MNGFTHPTEPPPPYSETNTRDGPLTSSTNPFFQSPQPQQQHPIIPQQPAQRQPSPAQYTSHIPQIQNYTITVSPNTRPSDLPYPAVGCDVRPHDWNAFVGQLVPEGSQRDEKRLSSERKRVVESVIAEWNRYFEGRGLRVLFDDGLGGGPTIPATGSSSRLPDNFSQAQQPQQFTSFSQAQAQHQPSHQYQPTNQPPQQLHPRPSTSSLNRWTQKLKAVAAEKDVSVTGSQIRVGDVFHLDPKSLKIGKFSLTGGGMEFGGRPIGPQSVMGRGAYRARPSGHVVPGGGGYVPSNGGNAAPVQGGYHGSPVSPLPGHGAGYGDGQQGVYNGSGAHGAPSYSNGQAQGGFNDTPMPGGARPWRPPTQPQGSQLGVSPVSPHPGATYTESREGQHRSPYSPFRDQGPYAPPPAPSSAHVGQTTGTIG